MINNTMTKRRGMKDFLDSSISGPRWFGHRQFLPEAGDARLTLSPGVHVEWQEHTVPAGPAGGVQAWPVTDGGIDAVAVALPPGTGWARLRLDLDALAAPRLTGLRLMLRLDQSANAPAAGLLVQAALGHMPHPDAGAEMIQPTLGRLHLAPGAWHEITAALLRPASGPVAYAAYFNLPEETQLTLALVESSDLDAETTPAMRDELGQSGARAAREFRAERLEDGPARARAAHGPVFAADAGLEGDRITGWVLTDDPAARLTIAAGGAPVAGPVPLRETCDIIPGLTLPCGFDVDIAALRLRGDLDEVACHLARADAADPLAAPAFAKLRLSQAGNAADQLAPPQTAARAKTETITPRNSPERLIFSLPDLSATDPSQRLLFRAMTQAEVDSGDIDRAISALLDPAERRPVVVHLADPGALLASAGTETAAEALADDIARKLAFFLHQGGEVVWTLDAPPGGGWPGAVRRLGQAIADLGGPIHLHSESQRDPLLAAWGIAPAPERIVIAPPGSTFGHYPDYAPRAAARARLGLPEEATLFLLFGRLTDGKGIARAVAAFNTLRESQPQAHLLILGNTAPGMARGTMRRRYGGLPHVRVIESHVSDSTLHWHFRAADWALMPYADARTPSALITAMGFGLPVIAPARGMIADILPADAGMIYDPEAPDGLEQSLSLAAATRPGTRRDMAARALAAAKAMRWEPAAEAIGDALGRRPARRAVPILFDDRTRDALLFGAAFPPPAPARTAVLILNYENCEDTERLIASLAAGTDTDFDVYVIDNGSPSVTEAELLHRFGAHRILRLPENLGYAAGNNAALRLIRSVGYRYVTILNPDLTAPPEALERLVAAAEARPEPAIFGPVLLRGNDPHHVASAGCHLSISAGLVTGHMFAGELASVLPEAPYEADFVTGAALFFRAEVLSMIGTMPESYFLYFEESDWLTRARAAGVPSVVLPQVRMSHHKRSESGDLPAPYFFYYYIRNAQVFVARLAAPGDDGAQTRARIKSDFIDPWLERIGRAAPDRLPFFTRLAERALADGAAGLTGPVDLIGAELAEAGAPLADARTCTGLRLRLLTGPDGAPKIAGTLDLPIGAPTRGPWTIAAVSGGRILAKGKLDQTEDGPEEHLSLDMALPPGALEPDRGQVLTLYLNGRKTGTVSAYLPRPTPRYEGKFVSFNAYACTGWLRNLAEPGRPAEVEILSGGKVVGRGIADLPVNQGNCGFSIRLPRRFSNGKAQTFALRGKGSTQIVAEDRLEASMGQDRPFRTDPGKVPDLLFLRQELWFGQRKIADLPVVEHLRAKAQELRATAASERAVSIVMPVTGQDARAPLARAILSVLDQTHSDWELLLAPMGPDEAALAAALLGPLDDPRLRLVAADRAHATRAAARNAALDQASTEIIAHLDASSRWDPDFLAVQLTALAREDEETGAVFCGEWLAHRVLDKDGETETEELIGLRGGQIALHKIENRPPGALGCLVTRRRLLDRIGRFDAAMPDLEDWQLLLRLTDQCAPAAVPAPLVTTDIGPAPLRLLPDLARKRGMERTGTTIDRLVSRYGAAADQRTTGRGTDVVFLMTEGLTGADPAGRIAERVAATLAALPDPEHCHARVIVPGDLQAAVTDALPEGPVPCTVLGLKSVSVLAEPSRSTARKAFLEALKARRPEADLLLLRAHVQLHGGALAELQTARDRCPEGGVFVTRHTVEGRSPEARKHHPASWRERDVCIAISALKGNLRDPGLDRAGALIELSATDPFCLSLTPDMAQAAEAALAECTAGDFDALLGPWLSALCLGLGKRIVYSGRARAFEMPL